MQQSQPPTQVPTISGFQLRQRIGKGGMAYVYLAVQEGLNREVAIKVLQPTRAEEPSIREQFLLEGRIIAGFNHPNIVMVYASGEERGNCYLAMEYLSGGTLLERIKGGLTPAEAVRIVRAVAAALHTVHQAGFVHRDIKPQNIVFRGDGAPVLTDFGIAKTYVDNWDAERTGTGIKKGTVRYMSPEQINGNVELDGRSDLYSLGVVFYYMLLGRLPYDSDTIHGLLQEILGGEIPPLPAELARFQPILDRLLIKDRQQRFADAGAFIQALDELDRPAPAAKPAPVARPAPVATPTPAPAPPPWRRPAPLAGAALGLVAVLVAALWLWPGGSTDPGDIVQTSRTQEPGAPPLPPEDPQERENLIAQIENWLVREADAEQAQRQIVDRKASLEELRQQLEALKSQVTTNEAQIQQENQAVEEDEAALESQHDALAAEQAELDSVQTELQAKQAELEEERANIEERRTALQETRDALQERLQTLGNEGTPEIQEERQRIQSLAAEIAGLEQQIEALQAGGEETLTQLQEQSQRLEDQQRQVQQTLDSLRAEQDRERQQAEQELAQKRGQLANLHAELNGLSEELEAARAGYQQELAGLESQRQSLREQIAAQEDAIIEETAALEEQVATMRETVALEETELTGAIASQQRQLQSLRDTARDMRERLARADGNDPTVALLSEQLETARAILSALEAQVADIDLPEPVPPEVEALLAEARGLIAGDQLTVGSRNALGVCQEIRALHANSGDSCLEEVVDRFHTLTLEKLTEDDRDTANTYIDRGLEIRPNHLALSALKRSLSLLDEALALIESDRFLMDGENDGLARLLASHRTSTANPLTTATLSGLVGSVREGNNLVQGNMDRQINALNRGLQVVAEVLLAQPGDEALLALQQALEARLEEAHELQDQEIDLLLEAQRLADTDAFDQSVSPNACQAYQQVLAVNPANQEAREVLGARCLAPETVKQIDETLASVSSPPALDDGHPLIRVLGLSPRYHQACQGLSQIVEDLQSSARDLGPAQREEALLLLKDGLDLWPDHPQLWTLAGELREDLDPARADQLIDQAYNRQVRERVQEAWALYRRALALSPDNERVRQQIPKLARWSLAYRSRNLDYVMMADEIYRELLRMGEDYGRLENRLQRVQQLYQRRHARSAVAQRRLASLEVLMANQGRTPVVACGQATVAAAP